MNRIDQLYQEVTEFLETRCSQCGARLEADPDSPAEEVVCAQCSYVQSEVL